MNHLRFRSKVGITFALVFIVVVAIIGEALFASLRAHAIVVPAVLLLALIGWGWIALGTGYVITSTTLCVRSGPLRWRIPLASIWRLRASGTSWAAPALSLDRIEVSYRRFDSVLISPRDRAGFVRAVRARVPGVLVEHLPGAEPRSTRRLLIQMQGRVAAQRERAAVAERQLFQLQERVRSGRPKRTRGLRSRVRRLPMR